MDVWRKHVGGEFVFSVSRDFVRRCSVPAPVLPGDDTPRPAVTGRELPEILPDVETLHDRKGPAHLNEQRHRVFAFSEKHTPPETATGRGLRQFAKKEGTHPHRAGCLRSACGR